MWTHPIGTTAEFHLENTEVDSKLQFMPSIEPKDFAYLDSAIFVGPILEDCIQVKAHPYR